MPIQIINPIEYPGWDQLLTANENASFFHTSAWARVLYESYKYKPLYFASIDNGKLTALMPLMEIRSPLTGKRGVSLPFTDYCPAIAADQDHYQNILEDIIAYGKKAGWKSIEFRNGENPFLNARPSSNYYAHTLKLTPNEQDLLKSFRSSTKRNIKKAEKEGVKAELHQSYDAIKEFYRLNCITRKHHGLPPQPFLFFKNIFKHVISHDHGHTLLAYHNKKIIAGAVYFHFRDKALYKYGASETRYQHLRANNLVMWEAIKWYAKHGYQLFDFGRTEPENEGLLQFKRGWGTAEKSISYYKYDLTRNAFESNKAGIRSSYPFLKLTPLPLLKLAGRLLYRHVG
jgi:hypothetical protein